MCGSKGYISDDLGLIPNMCAWNILNPVVCSLSSETLIYYFLGELNLTHENEGDDDSSEQQGKILDLLGQQGPIIIEDEVQNMTHNSISSIKNKTDIKSCSLLSTVPDMNRLKNAYCMVEE